jgi:RNA polymerase sigma-70 factor (ECF subfamily)
MSDDSAADAVRAFAHRRAINGQESALDEAFAEFYVAAFPRVYSFIRMQVSSVALAEELVARVFLKAYRNRTKLPDGEGSLTWLFRIARNTVIDHWRVEGRRDAADVSLDELADVADAQPNPEILYAEKELQAMALRLIGTMSIDDRVLLGLKFMAQRTNREVAAILGISEAAVSMRLLRALRVLKDRLSDQCSHE